MKRAIVLLVASIVLCSGCGVKQREIPPAPLILNLPDCPAPNPPALPLIDGSAPLDGPENAAAFLERDDVLRAYIDGLTAALRCYRQGKEKHESE